MSHHSKAVWKVGAGAGVTPHASSEERNQKVDAEMKGKELPRVYKAGKKLIDETFKGLRGKAKQGWDVTWGERVGSPRVHLRHSGDLPCWENMGFLQILSHLPAMPGVWDTFGCLK